MKSNLVQRIVGVVTALAVLGSSAVALGQPQTGYAIQQGFTPDPFIVDGTGGGTVPGAQIQTGCNGNYQTQPAAIFVARSGFPFLRFAVASSQDTTIIVRGPNGATECNDDTDGFNPVADFRNAPAGNYSVFVGSYRAGETPQFRLAVTVNQAFLPSTLGAGAHNNPQPTPQGTQGVIGPLNPTGRPRLGRIVVPANLNVAQVRRGNARGSIGISGDVHGDGVCRGFTTVEPTYVLDLRQSLNFVRAFVVSASDTTLVIRHPDGSIQCNDDTVGLHPMIEGGFAAGVHQIWVGSYRAGVTSLFQLTVTANQGDRPPTPN